MIIAVGLKADNDRAVRFREWTNSVAKGYTIRDWTVDNERLKGDGWTRIS